MRNRFGEDEDLNPVDQLRSKAEIKESLSDARAQEALDTIQGIQNEVFQGSDLKFVVFGNGDREASIEVHAAPEILEYVRGQIRSLALPLDPTITLDTKDLQNAPLLQGTLFGEDE